MKKSYGVALLALALVATFSCFAEARPPRVQVNNFGGASVGQTVSVQRTGILGRQHSIVVNNGGGIVGGQAFNVNHAFAGSQAFALHRNFVNPAFAVAPRAAFARPFAAVNNYGYGYPAANAFVNYQLVAPQQNLAALNQLNSYSYGSANVGANLAFAPNPSYYGSPPLAAAAPFALTNPYAPVGPQAVTQSQTTCTTTHAVGPQQFVAPQALQAPPPYGYGVNPQALQTVPSYSQCQ